MNGRCLHRLRKSAYFYFYGATALKQDDQIQHHQTMKLPLKALILGISVMMFNAGCEKNSTTPKLRSNSINKILPLGASRVEGARPAFESYRYELWKDLNDGGWTFDFIGTQTDEASYRSYNGNEFDPDHEGRGGWTSGQILSEIEGWLDETGPPDIVLLSSPGGNDALEEMPFEDAVSNINAIIAILQAHNRNVTIIIEQMAPGRTDIMTPELTRFFEQMHQAVLNMANHQTTPTSRVIAVDIYTGFDDRYLADEVHYNAAGAEFVANRYYNVLENILEE